MRININGEFLE